MYTIKYKLPDEDEKKEKKDILSEIKSLKQLPAESDPNKNYNDFMKSYKEKERKKKEEKELKKKEKKEQESKKSDVSYSGESFINLGNIMYNTLEDSIDDDIINGQKRGYNKLKADENAYKKEFAEELTLLYNLLDETSTFGKKLEKKFELFSDNKNRGVSKFSNDMAMTMLSTKNSKLAILREISNIKKVIADLKIKEKKGVDDGGANSNMEKLASNYLKGVLSYGRGDFIKSMTDTQAYSGMSHTDTEALTGYDSESLDQKINDALIHGESYRSQEGNKYIEMEMLGIKTLVEKNIDNGEWEFINVDRDKQKVYGYPIPDRNKIKKMKFSDDGRYAIDTWGVMYPVIEICSY
jgi:hypothetical protein